MKAPTILNQDIKALLNEKIGVEDDESEGERENIITCSHLEELPDRFLRGDEARQPHSAGQMCEMGQQTGPRQCLRRWQHLPGLAAGPCPGRTKACRP